MTDALKGTTPIVAFAIIGNRALCIESTALKDLKNGTIQNGEYIHYRKKLLRNPSIIYGGLQPQQTLPNEPTHLEYAPRKQIFENGVHISSK